MTDPTPLEGLRADVRAALRQLDGLLAEAELLGEAAAPLREASAQISRRLDEHELSVAIVGEKKAGKSTFINALLGAPVLSAAVRECTGTVSLIRTGPTPDYLARRLDGRVERFAARHPDRSADRRAEIEALRPMAEGSPEAAAFVQALEAELAELDAERRARFAEEVAELTDQDRRGREIRRLELWWPARHLPDDLVLIDTPGVNTSEPENRERAWAALRERADGCLLVSDLNQAVSRSTLDFLEALRPLVPHVLLALTKLDRAMENAEEVGGDPEEEAEEARQVGLRRFAKAAGRDPEEIGAITVAALPVLEGDPVWTARFEAEVARLMQMLRAERGAVLATRAAAALTQAEGSIREALAVAERRSAERVAALQAQALDDPEAFIRKRIEALRPQVQARVRRVVRELEGALPDLLFEVDLRMSGILRATRDKAALQRVVDELRPTLGRELHDGFGRLRRQARASLDEAHRALVVDALEALRERYRIAGELRAVELMVDTPELEAGDFVAGVALSAELGDLVEQHEEEQRTWGLGGAAVGAALGLMLGGGLLLPVALALGLGGGVVGALQPLSRLQDRCCDAVTQALADARPALVTQLRSSQDELEALLLAELEASLRRATERFGLWIAEVLAEERAVVEAERGRGAALQDQGAALLRLAAGLRERVAAVAPGSLGLAARAWPRV
ncbi:MAG: dynamin family protein [Alphaproteobacteria bacterium]|nr:dynamin family protein [Alphaproteobacteria bacterium]MCB9795988.1 dynamin family protein [Alphaproteobacteria bacterium]